MINNLAATDLNLLVVLDALLEERHVTRAGTRVGLSQPATSNALKRLRRIFDDALLEQHGSKMELTPLALALQDPVKEALVAAQRVFSEQDAFDPAQAHRRVRIAATDHFLMLAMPTIELAVARDAPGLSLEVSQFGVVDDLELLADDRLDLVVGTFDNLPMRLRRRRLFHDDLACLMRDDHPALSTAPESESQLPLPTFLTYPHLRVAPRAGDGGAVAGVLADLGADRRVACQIPTFLAAPFILQHTDLLCVMSIRVARRFCELLPLAMRRPPLPLAGFDTDLVWHARSDADPVLLWVRERVEENCEFSFS